MAFQKLRLKTILADANSIKLEETFSSGLWNYLNNESERVGIRLEFLLPCLLSTTSFCMAENAIYVDEDYQLSCVMYSALVANPSTGKTTGLNLMKKAIYNIEEFLGIDEDDSNLVNSATVEALCSIMKEQNCVLSLYDESSTFMGSFGRYTAGSGSYDRAIYLELFNGERSYRRDLSNGKRTCIKKPRLNLCLLGHPQSFIKAMHDEKENKDDGLMLRFLASCPQPVFSSAETINAARSENRSLSLTALLYAVYLVNHQYVDSDIQKESNAQQRIFNDYKLALDTKNEYDKVFTNYRNVCKEMNEIDIFISAMYGKSITHILRLSAILQTLENAFELLSKTDLVNKLVLSQDLTSKLQTKIAAENDLTVVRDTTFLRAKKLIEYFTLNRLVMAGYKFRNISDSNEMCIEYILESTKTFSKLILDERTPGIIQAIFKMPGKEVICNHLNQEKKYGADLIKGAFTSLESLKLGVTRNYNRNPTGKGVSLTMFVKISPEELKENKDLVFKLEHIGVDYETYLLNYNLKSKELKENKASLNLMQSKLKKQVEKSIASKYNDADGDSTQSDTFSSRFNYVDTAMTSLNIDLLSGHENLNISPIGSPRKRSYTPVDSLDLDEYDDERDKASETESQVTSNTESSVKRKKIIKNFHDESAIISSGQAHTMISESSKKKYQNPNKTLSNPPKKMKNAKNSQASTKSKIIKSRASYKILSSTENEEELDSESSDQNIYSVKQVDQYSNSTQNADVKTRRSSLRSASQKSVILNSDQIN